MRAESSVSTGQAIVPRGTSAVESSMAGKCPVVKTSDGKSAVDDWFGAIARNLLPEKPGTALHYITGYDERLCQRYAAGHVKPSAYFLRALFRSDQGEPFFLAVMHGCEAPWWIEFQKHQRMGAAADRAK